MSSFLPGTCSDPPTKAIGKRIEPSLLRAMFHHVHTCEVICQVYQGEAVILRELPPRNISSVRSTFRAVPYSASHVPTIQLLRPTDGIVQNKNLPRHWLLMQPGAFGAETCETGLSTAPYQKRMPHFDAAFPQLAS